MRRVCELPVVMLADCSGGAVVGPDVKDREYNTTEPEDELFLALDRGHIDCEGVITVSHTHLTHHIVCEGVMTVSHTHLTHHIDCE